MKWIILLVVVTLLAGCDTEASRIESEKFQDAAIKSVQESESTARGISCIKRITGTVQTLEALGNHVKIKGWMAYKEPGHAVVVFQIDNNAKTEEWKWYIEDGVVIPISDLAQMTTKSQRAKYM